MAKIGYMPYLPKYAEGAADRKWMEDFGCENIVEEQPVEGAYRLGGTDFWQTLAKATRWSYPNSPMLSREQGSCHSFWNSAG